MGNLLAILGWLLNLSGLEKVRAASFSFDSDWGQQALQGDAFIWSLIAKLMVVLGIGMLFGPLRLHRGSMWMPPIAITTFVLMYFGTGSNSEGVIVIEIALAYLGTLITGFLAGWVTLQVDAASLWLGFTQCLKPLSVVPVALAPAVLLAGMAVKKLGLVPGIEAWATFETLLAVSAVAVVGLLLWGLGIYFPVRAYVAAHPDGSTIWGLGWAIVFFDIALSLALLVPGWAGVAAAAAMGLAAAFYLHSFQQSAISNQVGLATLRGALLALIAICLANPVLNLRTDQEMRRTVCIVIDGTESMLIEDSYAAAERAKLESAIGKAESKGTSKDDKRPASRLDFVKALLSREDRNLLERLSKEKNVDIEVYQFDGTNTNQLHRLELHAPADATESLSPKHVATNLTATGQVTAIGTILKELNRQQRGGRLGAVLMVSDFVRNAGPAPIGKAGGGSDSPASQLGVPVYTLGVGATESVDIAVRLMPPPKLKKGERSPIAVKLEQSGLSKETVNVKLTARRLGGSEGSRAEIITIGQKPVTLSGPSQNIEFDFTPQEAGRFEFMASVDPQPGESVEENNRAAREVNVIDDFLRLMYVAHEPNWEWRFIKEVFHRDKLVGMRGFRTFLRSSDPKVRQSNALFLPALTPKRSDFFANDVIFLGDMAARDLSPRFCEMTKEFVGKFGGSLVVLSGPRFGPGEIAQSPLNELMPVVADPNLRIRDQREFLPDISAMAPEYSFMRIAEGESRAAIEQDWRRLMGSMPWYQPVKRLKVDAVALASHPSDTCDDGKTPQPLIATRRYGAGEVVYLAFDETWRLRRRYGEKYYRQFWSQLIYRLGMSHALGDQKRFVVRTDRQQYQADQVVTLMVEAYDANYEPLREDKIPDNLLKGELVLPAQPGEAATIRPIDIPQLREGEFELRIPVLAAGDYSIRVRDPVDANRYEEVRFTVTSLSAERRVATRDQSLQEKIASESGGKSYDLTSVDQMVDDLTIPPASVSNVSTALLWSTRLCFLLGALLLGTEWLARKSLNLP